MTHADEAGSEILSETLDASRSLKFTEYVIGNKLLISYPSDINISIGNSEWA